MTLGERIKAVRIAVALDVQTLYLTTGQNWWTVVGWYVDSEDSDREGRFCDHTRAATAEEAESKVASQRDPNLLICATFPGRITPTI